MTGPQIIAILGSYFAGSLPFGYWIALARGVDIRTVGSGNIGATNVHRVLGKKLGLSVFILDVSKGLIPALAGAWIFGSKEGALLCGFLAITGHCLSPFLGFRGGKGIATGLGALLGVSWPVALLAFAAFLVCLGLSRYVSLSSMVAAVSTVPLGFLFRNPSIVIAAYAVLAAFIVWRHLPNIKRLREGTESPFSFKGGSPSKPEGSVGSSHIVALFVVLSTSSTLLFLWS